MTRDFGPEAGDYILDLTALARIPKTGKRELRLLAKVAHSFLRRFGGNLTTSERELFRELTKVLKITVAE